MLKLLDPSGIASLCISILLLTQCGIASKSTANEILLLHTPKGEFRKDNCHDFHSKSIFTLTSFRGWLSWNHWICWQHPFWKLSFSLSRPRFFFFRKSKLKTKKEINNIITYFSQGLKERIIHTWDQWTFFSIIVISYIPIFMQLYHALVNSCLDVLKVSENLAILPGLPQG